ncbi:MAG: class I SAM-dependent methyltransferase [Deltaproteobacteria bacterium]
MTDEALRTKILQQAQGAAALNVAFIGVANRLFDAVEGETSVADLAAKASVDAGYLQRWCEAAYAFGYLDEHEGRFSVTDLGRAFRPDTPGTLMPLAIQSVLGAHMADRAAGFMKTGERPGESVLAESASILPWFGPILEAGFGAMFEREILPNVAAYRDVDERGGLAVDLGCGNGWYLRKLVRRFPKVRGLGLDGFEENIRQATERASAEGLGARLTFETGDIYGFGAAEPVDLIAMNRALHHVWDQRDKVFAILRDSLRPGGVAVIWEPSWPQGIEALREPRRRGMAFQNLSEHVQGNHFLRPEEIEAAFRGVGMTATTQLFGEGTEAVVVGRREA